MAYGATGVVTIGTPQTGVKISSSSNGFTLTGTYLMSSDNTPTGLTTDASCRNANKTAILGSSFREASYVGIATHAYVGAKLDGKPYGRGIGQITNSWDMNVWNDIGVIKPFSISIGTKGLKLGSHTISIQMNDAYMIKCADGMFGREQHLVDPIPFAEKTITFTIADSSPSVSINLNKPSLTGCEPETGTIIVTSNDPTPNGGTVTLTFPNGSTASAPFTGQKATLTFADFGLLNGYSGAHQPGDVLTFKADVTTTAGHTKTASANAKIIPGGLTVTMIPAKITVEPTLNNLRGWMQKKGTNQSLMAITVSTLNQTPVIGATMNSQVQLGMATYGGHDHALNAANAALKPKGTLSPIIDNKDGTYSTTYTASIFSSEEKLVFDVSYKGCVGTVASPVITSKVPGLVPVVLPASGLHAFVGGTCAHHGAATPWRPDNLISCGGATGRSNQYLTAYRAGLLDRLLSLYEQRWGAGLYVNDASLQFGGTFDTNSDWAYMPHSNHRLGLDVDLALKDSSISLMTLPTAVGIDVVFDRILTIFDDEKDLAKYIEVKIHGGNHIHLKPNMNNWSGK
ncbi:MAG: hypothetical protein R8K22_08870 [Mariprofundaceae bacterium]